jgi:hypothetical protein
MFPLSTLESHMSAELVFSIANLFALGGWLLLALAVWRGSTWLRDELVGRFWPLGLSAFYLALIVLFFGKADGGFDSLANVQKLFAAPWVALAGWVHYLAFDLFMGAWIAKAALQQGLSRLWLIGLLPLTFLFGPIGYVAYQILNLLTRPASTFQEVKP